MAAPTTDQEALLRSLRFEAARRDFGLRSARERQVARHFYLLALEEVERELAGRTQASPHHAA